MSSNKKEVLRVLLISVGYVTDRTPSDKQFVTDLIENIPKDVEVAIWSLNDANPSCKKCKTGNKRFLYINKNRIFHKPFHKDGEGKYSPHALHSNLRNTIEINTTFAWDLIYRLRDFIRLYKPDLVHLTDSIGPITWLLKFVLKECPLTITKPTVRMANTNKNILYNIFIKLSLRPADGIITFTRAAKRQFNELGINANIIHVIPWGVAKVPKEVSKEKVARIRQKYGCRNGQLLIVGSKRSSAEEFIKEVESSVFFATKLNARFVFAIKPTRYKEEWTRYSAGPVMIEKGPVDYYDLLGAADALYSPVGREIINSTSLLPLTWIEAMVRKTPVITQLVPGVEDLVLNGNNGVTFKNRNNTLEALLLLNNSFFLNSIQNNAKVFVEENFSIKIIAQQYLGLWEKLSGKRCLYSN